MHIIITINIGNLTKLLNKCFQYGLVPTECVHVFETLYCSTTFVPCKDHWLVRINSTLYALNMLHL